VKTPEFPQVNFDFSAADPITALIVGGILFLFVGLISAIFILVLGICFLILGRVLLAIGILWGASNN